MKIAQSLKREEVIAGDVRIEALRAQYFKNRPELCIERDILYTQSFRETKGESMEIRRAKAFRKVLENIPVVIQENELVVGSPSKKPRGTASYPELQVDWVEEELDVFETREQDPFVVSEATKKFLREEIFSFWRGSSLYDQFLTQLPEETAKVVVDKGIIGHNVLSQMGQGHYSPSWGFLLGKGFEALKEMRRRN